MIEIDPAPLVAELLFPLRKVCPLICSKHDAKTRACRSHVHQKAAVEAIDGGLPVKGPVTTFLAIPVSADQWLRSCISPVRPGKLQSPRA